MFIIYVVYILLDKVCREYNMEFTNIKISESLE